jgi:hypothetical protein
MYGRDKGGKAKTKSWSSRAGLQFRVGRLIYVFFKIVDLKENKINNIMIS